MNSNVSAWTFGGSILSFAFPMLLFIVVAGALYVLYTKPEFVPGHRAPGLERPVSYTPVPGKALGPEARWRKVLGYSFGSVGQPQPGLVR